MKNGLAKNIITVIIGVIAWFILHMITFAFNNKLFQALDIGIAIGLAIWFYYGLGEEDT